MNGKDLHQTDECDRKKACKPNSKVSPRQPKRACQTSNDDGNQPHDHASRARVDVS